MRRLRRQKGYLTVYMALMLAVLLPLCFALIEGVRYWAMRAEAECVTDIGMNSIFAEFHRELYRQYNLFAIDVSYGTERATVHNTQQHLYEYLDRNFSCEDLFLNRWLYRDFLGLAVQNVGVDMAALYTDEGGTVFRARAVEAVKSDMGLDLLESLKEWMTTIEVQGFCDRSVADEKAAVDAEFQAYDGMRKQISEKEWFIVHVDNPTQGLEAKRNQGILKNVIEDTEALSARRIDESSLVSGRMQRKELSQGNCDSLKPSDLDGAVERFLFQEYLMNYMGHYGRSDDTNALLYQMEYLIAGQEQDVENLRKVAERLCALREAANAAYLFSSGEKCAVAETLSVAITTLLMIPEAADLLKTSLLLGWAYAESLYDVKTLLGGGRIPLMKSDATWHYGLEFALAIEKPDNQSADQGLSYEDYLRIFAMMVNEDTLTIRAMNMVEADIRLTAGNAAFRLDACCDRLRAKVQVGSGYGYHFELIRQKYY